MIIEHRKALQPEDEEAHDADHEEHVDDLPHFHGSEDTAFKVRKRNIAIGPNVTFA